MGRWGPGPYWSDGIASDVMYVPISGLFCVLMYPDLMMFSCIGWPNINGPFSFYFVPPAQLLKFLESNDTWISIFSNLAYISLRLKRQNQSVSQSLTFTATMSMTTTIKPPAVQVLKQLRGERPTTASTKLVVPTLINKTSLQRIVYGIVHAAKGINYTH